MARSTRRGHGEGSISQRTDGRWHIRIDLGRGIDGQRRTKHAYANTEADAVALLRRMGGRVANGQLLATSTPTVAAYLRDWYDAGIKADGEDWRPSTKRGYRVSIESHLIPAFGPLRLEQLTPLRIQAWLKEHKQTHGARRRIALAHATLRSALSSAKRLQLVAINAAELVAVPKSKARPIVPLTVAQALTLLDTARTHRLEALFSVALACGLRLGEALGLQWTDVDLDAGDVQIRRQLQLVKAPGQRRQQPVLLDYVKTDRSRRTIVLPLVCIDALRRHQTKQREDRLRAGDRWVHSDFVFTTYNQLARPNRRAYRPVKDRRPVGKPLHPRNVLRTLHQLLDAAKLPRCRFHDLRHSAASMLLAQGIQLAEVSLLLGHSELRVTADLYAHLQRETGAKAARYMDALLNR